MSRERVLTDKQWARIEPLTPSSDGQKSRPFRDHRHVVEGIVAGVLGVVHAFGEFRPALVRHGGELHEHGGALDDVRAGFAEEGEELLVRRLHP
jgi:hypothetical protein